MTPPILLLLDDVHKVTIATRAAMPFDTIREPAAAALRMKCGNRDQEEDATE